MAQAGSEASKVIVIYALCSFVSLFIQSSIIHLPFPDLIAPNLLLVIVTHISINYRNIAGVFGVFAVGFLLDLASGVYLGPHAAGAIVVFLFAGFFIQKVFIDNFFVMMLVVFVFTIVNSLTYSLIVSVYADTAVVSKLLLVTTLKEAFVTALFSPLVLKILNAFASPVGSIINSRRVSY